MNTPFEHKTPPGNRRFFPSTHWSLLDAVKDEVTEDHRAVLNTLIERYWKPVYYYLRKRGYEEEVGKDLTQAFFTHWLQRDLFGRADASKGRFRTYLLTSLNHFLSNARRAERAKKRYPVAGFVSIHELSPRETEEPIPDSTEDPEMLFHRRWLAELLHRALRSLQLECESTGKQTHYTIFRRSIIEPVLAGSTPVARSDLSKELGLTEKQVSNRLLTARRAYRRLLREEIRVYAASEHDVDQEMRDLFLIMESNAR